MSTPIPDLLQGLSAYRYIILFPLAIFEGPIVTVIAGFLASIGQMELFISYIIIICADLVGDTLYYLLGKWGGRVGIHKWGNYVGINEQRMAKLGMHFKRHPAKTILLGKLAHGFGGPVLAAAGLASMPYRNFILLNLVPTIPKSLILILIGYYFGIANNIFDSFIIILLLLSIVLFLIFFIIPRFSERFLIKNKSNHANPDSK